METYKIDPDIYLKNIQKNTIIYASIYCLIGLIGSSVFIRDYLSDPGKTPLVGLCIFLGIIIPFGIYRILKIRKKMKASAAIFKLKIEEDRLTKQSFGRSDLTILFSEIETIYQYKNGLILIQAPHIKNPVFIPASIENRVQLEDKLKQIMPFATNAPKAGILPLRMALAVISFICLGCYFLLQKEAWLYAGLVIFLGYYYLKSRNK